MSPARVVAILGAQRSGKTALARSLSERLAELSGLRCTWVAEGLRGGCEREGRTPRADEQRALACEQQARIDAAAASHDLVIADTTPLMTAVCSSLHFDDLSLMPMALEAQRRCSLTLLTALDLPGTADGRQGDGAQAREDVQRRLRALLCEHRIAWSLIGGQGAARTEAAVDAVAPLLLPMLATPARAGAGLFTRLAEREAAQPRWTGPCEKCDVPECEHAALRSARRSSADGR